MFVGSISNPHDLGVLSLLSSSYSLSGSCSCWSLFICSDDRYGCLLMEVIVVIIHTPSVNIEIVSVCTETCFHACGCVRDDIVLLFGP